MKIRTKLTLRYTIVTAAIVSVLIAVILIFANINREKEFFRVLQSEAITKAHLFLNGRVNPVMMHDIYMNNREFINEVEVAIYDSTYTLVYHDATEIDIVKETPEMLREILEGNNVEFHEGDYQIVGFTYDYYGEHYIVTAAAYDGYGHAKQRTLVSTIILIWLVGILLLAVVGYLLAKMSLASISAMVDEVESITSSNIDKRLEVPNPGDELGELAQTFNLMLERLEKAFNNQKMFVSNISHELRTPLAALIAEFDVILFRNRSADEYREAIEHARLDAKKIERLSLGLLDLAKADYDTNQISLRNIRLDELLFDACDILAKANPDFNVDLIFDEMMEDETMITVKGNEYLLKTAFVNLMENNCKFSADKTSRVNISFFQGNSVLRFSDTGIGMSKEEVKNMFTPFYRGKNSNNTSGHGIGMALVHKILHLHQGTIRVRSQEGEGTVFILEIPHI